MVKGAKQMTNSQKAIQAAQAEVSRLWILMCDEEGVAHDAKFVVFNSTNSVAVEYNAAVKKFFRAKRYQWTPKTARMQRGGTFGS